MKNRNNGRCGGNSIVKFVLLPSLILLTAAALLSAVPRAGEVAESLSRRRELADAASRGILEHAAELGSGLEDPHVYIRETALAAIQDLSVTVRTAIDSALCHGDEAVRWAALTALTGDPTSKDYGLFDARLFGKALEDDSFFVRRAALSALLKLVEDVNTIIEKALLNDDPFVRRTAMEILLRRVEDAEQTLEAALSHEDPDIRKEAMIMHADRMAPDKAVSYLASVLAEDEGGGRVLAIELLGGIRPRTGEITGLLRPILRDEDFDAWVAAVSALFPVNPPLEERQGIEPESIRTVKDMRLPRSNWRFKKDIESNGHLLNWFEPGHDDSKWQEAEIETAWEQGYIGTGWYRRWIELPERPEHASAELVFSGVDESGWAWVNGVYAGGQDIGPGGWDKPFRVEATEELRWGERNHITVRVKNTAFAGGIWRPITLEALETGK